MLSATVYLRRSARRRRRQETFGGVENPGIDELGLGRFALEFSERSGEAHPVEKFLLTARFDRRGGIIAPCVVVSPAQCIEQGAIPGRVGIEVMVFFPEKSFRPSPPPPHPH